MAIRSEEWFEPKGPMKVRGGGGCLVKKPFALKFFVKREHDYYDYYDYY